jgi:hypothetical protein
VRFSRADLLAYRATFPTPLDADAFTLEV